MLSWLLLLFSEYVLPLETSGDERYFLVFGLSGWKWPKRGTTVALGNRAGGSTGDVIISPKCGTRSRTVFLHLSCWISVLIWSDISWPCLFLPLVMEMCVLCHCMLERSKSSFDLIGVNVRDFLESQKRLWTLWIMFKPLGFWEF